MADNELKYSELNNALSGGSPLITDYDNMTFIVRVYAKYGGDPYGAYVHYFDKPNITPVLVDPDTHQVVGWQIELQEIV